MAIKSLSGYSLIIWLALPCAPAHAVTASDLRTWCETLDREELSNAEAMAYVQCLAYVQGVVDSLLVLAEGARGPLLCIPDSLSYTEAAALVRRYLQRNPARRQLSAARAITLALQEEFPCSPP